MRSTSSDRSNIALAIATGLTRWRRRHGRRDPAARLLVEIQFGESRDTVAAHGIGTISHYFPKPQVGIVKLITDLKVGEMLRFSGHGAEFRQTVTSMQLDHVAVETAAPGAEVAIQVDQRVREGTHVYRITP